MVAPARQATAREASRSREGKPRTAVVDYLDRAEDAELHSVSASSGDGNTWTCGNWTTIGPNMDDSWPLSPNVEAMHETYRMLGKEHESNLEREAEKLNRAGQIRRQARTTASPSSDGRLRKPQRFARMRIFSFLARTARGAS